MNLLVISNHNPVNWSEEQKAGWNKIEYIPFPEVNPTWDRDKVKVLANELIIKMEQITGYVFGYAFETPHVFMNSNEEWRFCIQGEYTLSSELYYRFGEMKNLLVFPTTRRVVVDNGDGTFAKVFEFVRWR